MRGGATDSCWTAGCGPPMAHKLKQGCLHDGFKARDIHRNQWRNLTTTEAIKDAIAWLEE
jgi:hypothetical protein